MSKIRYRDLINRDLPFRERGCTSKTPFATRAEARAVVRHGRHGDGSVKPYHCRWEDHWHLGHHRHAELRRRRAGWRRLRARELEVWSWSTVAMGVA